MDTIKSDKGNDVGEFLGGLKRFQIFNFAVSVYVFAVLTWGSLSVTFLAPVETFQCSNLETDWAQIIEATDHCSYKIDDSGDSQACKSFNYSQSFYSFSYAQKFNLVCDKTYLIAVANSLSGVGDMIGSTILGYISDRFGRRPTVLFGCLPGIVASFMTLFAPNVIFLLVARVLYGISGMAIGSVVFVILMEICGIQYRGALAVACNFGWSLFYMVLPGLGWWLRDSFKIQIVITVGYLSLLILYWLLTESPRWLIVTGRYEEAKIILKKACEMNKITGNVEEFVETLGAQIKAEEKVKKVSILDLFRLPSSRRRTFILLYYWFVTSLVYYGISMNADIFGGNTFLNFFLFGLIEVPSYAIYTYVLLKQNRRIHLGSTMFMTGVFCVIVAVIPQETTWAIILLTVLGKFAICSSFALVYPYTCEVYPTSIRSLSLGLCSAAARVSGILAPFARDLMEIIGLPPVMGIFGAFGLTSGALVYFLPESNGIGLPDTLKQGENINKK